MQNLLIFQSMWAMERRHTDGIERSLETNLEMIVEADYDGVSAEWTDPAHVRRIDSTLKAEGLQAEGACFPKTIDDLKPVLELAAETGLHHLTIQPNVKPRRLQECVALLDGWRRLADQVDFPVYIETHRDRMTTDMFVVLDLLDCFPDLKLVGDISHFVVGREFVRPISEENQAYIKRILDNSWAFHGRVASCEQIQIEIGYPHHRPWVDLFLSWWDYGFRSWRKRAAADATLAFVCELGPKPYAITGPDGNDTVDRWTEALMLRELAREIWAKSAPAISTPFDGAPKQIQT